ncbi:MAG: hypothetical protein QM811_04480 [Pirellulales bacterium]
MSRPPLRLDFRPAPRGRWIPPVAAAILFAGCAALVWLWIAPIDRTARLERSLAVIEVAGLDDAVRELAALGAPGRKILLEALAHPRVDVRRVARKHWWEAVAGWSLRPARRPREFAELTVTLDDVLRRVPDAERVELRPWIEQWLSLDMSVELTANDPRVAQANAGYRDARANLTTLAARSKTPLPTMLAEPDMLVTHVPTPTINDARRRL